MGPVLLALERTLALTAEDQEAIGWFEEGGIMRPWLSATGPSLDTERWRHCMLLDLRYERSTDDFRFLSRMTRYFH